MATPGQIWDEQENRLVRFLLGDLPAEEAEQIEARVFEEPDFLDDVLAAGDDLIHAYLTASLEPDDQRRFESHFLASPLRRQRFEFVRAVVAAARAASSTPDADRPAAVPVAAPPARSRDARTSRLWVWPIAAALLLGLGWLAQWLRPGSAPDDRVVRQTVPSSTAAVPPTPDVSAPSGPRV